MPTGYTAGILDGEIMTFEQFAKSCMRAFGATIHMRDEPHDKPYQKQTPSEYHKKSISKLEKRLKEIKELSDDQLKAKIIEDKKNELLDCEATIKERKEHRKKLNSMLKKARCWNPPTAEHLGIKNFMINQLTDTIKIDCAVPYYEKRIKEIDSFLNDFDVDEYRADEIEFIKNGIEYHQEEYEKDLERCETSNKWVEDFIESL